MNLEYYCDTHKKDGVLRPHLVCIPYSIQNLHIMAKELGIKKCWFHKDHYDMPIRRTLEIMKRCKVVNTSEIMKIVGRPYNRPMIGYTPPIVLDLLSRDRD